MNGNDEASTWGPALTEAAIASAPHKAVEQLGPLSLGERWCIMLTRLPPLRRLHRRRIADAYLVYEADGSLRDTEAWGLRHDETAEQALRLFGPDGDLRGKVVVDLGCGDGGKARTWLKHGAASVIGVEADPPRVDRARSAAAAAGLSGRVRFELTDGGRLPLEDGSVDVVLMIDVMEHLDDPPSVLAECTRVLRPGGRVLNSFKPWLSPRGSHLNDWIYVPWCHLLVPERDLVRLLRRMAASNSYIFHHFPSLQDHPLPADLVALADGGLNRLTLRRFERIVADSDLRVRLHRLSGYAFGHRNAAIRALGGIGRLPLLREFAGGYVVTILEKER